MLYDKRWDKPEVKADPFTLENLIAWLEKQPADIPYDYRDCNGACLLDIYISSATGKRSTPKQETHWTTCGGSNNYVHIARSQPWTFGAALERARTLAAQA